MIPTSPPPAVAVIGAGFSGLLTALHLLSLDPSLRVRLIERRPRFGAGLAYSTDNPLHLLNVRAANMSAFPDQPDHFVRWLEAADGPVEGDAFVSRGRYGQYLQGLLRQAVGDPGRPGRLLLEQDEAIALRRDGAGWEVELAVGRRLLVNAVVLAGGPGPPSQPFAASAAALQSPRLVLDPWAADLDALPAGDILLVGSGLTMVDLALALARPDRTLVAASRRGLLPRRHGPATAKAVPAAALATPRRALNSLRLAAQETGWRGAVDGVRPVTREVWNAWSLAERRRFLRHLRPWWDVHRHRAAPQTHAAIEALRLEGQLQVLATRIEHVEKDAEGFLVRWRARGSRFSRSARFAAVVNCTGHGGDLQGVPLLAGLLAEGRAAVDPLGLGLELDDDLRLRTADGAPTPGLYAVGPLTRAARWEGVAAPDIRSQAAEAARTVLADLAGVPSPETV